MTKDERVSGFLAEYKTLCEKFSLYLSVCPHTNCGQYYLCPWNFKKFEIDITSITANTDKHNLPGDWDLYAPQKTVPQELPSSCDQIGSI